MEKTAIFLKILIILVTIGSSFEFSLLVVLSPDNPNVDISYKILDDKKVWIGSKNANYTKGLQYKISIDIPASTLLFSKQKDSLLIWRNVKSLRENLNAKNKDIAQKNGITIDTDDLIRQVLYSFKLVEVKDKNERVMDSFHLVYFMDDSDASLNFLKCHFNLEFKDNFNCSFSKYICSEENSPNLNCQKENKWKYTEDVCSCKCFQLLFIRYKFQSICPKIPAESSTVEPSTVVPGTPQTPMKTTQVPMTLMTTTQLETTLMTTQTQMTTKMEEQTTPIPKSTLPKETTQVKTEIPMTTPQTTQLVTKPSILSSPQTLPDTTVSGMSSSEPSSIYTEGFTSIPSTVFTEEATRFGSSPTVPQTQEITTQATKPAETTPKVAPTTQNLVPTSRKIVVTTQKIETFNPTTQATNREEIPTQQAEAPGSTQNPTVTKRTDASTIPPGSQNSTEDQIGRIQGKDGEKSLEKFKDQSGMKVDKGSVETIWIGILVGLILVLLILAAIYKYVRVSYFTLPVRVPLRTGDSVRYASFHDDFLMNGNN